MSDEDLKKKLDRFQNLIHSPQHEPPASHFPERYRTLAEANGGELVANHAGAYCRVRTLYPFEHYHGSCCLDDAAASATVPLSAFTSMDEPGELELSSMLFIDTETTGLGGAGAVAFLVGCGSLVEDGFEVRQYLLPDYSDECAMLEDLQQELREDNVLVSYNGATFDLPLLKDRLVINRVSKEIPYGYHVDLLHAVRRIFRRRLKDCRLSNIEKELFGFERTDDIPGYLIPAVYFEWLSSDSLELLPEVLNHNRLDILSLFYLVDHIATIHRSQGEALEEIDDLHSLSRVYSRRRDHTTVESLIERIEGTSGSGLAEDIQLFNAFSFKRANSLEKAVPIWLQLAGSESREGFWANIELAKYFEHRVHDPARAFQHASRAHDICPYGEARQRKLALRIDRLRAKLRLQK